MRIPTATASVAIFLFCFEAAADGPKPEGEVEVEVLKDLAYRDGKDADPERHKLDLYLPKGRKGFPVLLFVHGGGWSKGDRTSFEKQAHTLARNGVGVASVGYRLTPQVRHPAHVQDVAAAFAWVHANVGKHGGRADRLFLSGHSAGGHLVALLAADDRYLRAEKLSPADVRGVIPISGVYAIRPGRWAKTFGEDEAGCRDASPQTHTRAGLPPFLILYADKDGVGFDGMAEDFGEALRKAEVEAKCLKVADRTHASIVGRMADAGDPATRAVLEFIARHGDTKPAVKP